MSEAMIKPINPSGEKTGYLKQLFQIDAPQDPVFYEAAEKAAERLSDIKKDDVKGTAASQIELLSRFYGLSLSQAQRSFRWAIAASMVGLLFFLAAIGFVLMVNQATANVALIGGGIIQFISGINFYLYNKTLSQLTLFQGRLETTQRFLLANSLTESLGDELRDVTRAQLINQLANSQYDKLSGRRSVRDRNHHKEEEEHA